MSNKHKHYEMIVAKAANMDLVKFIKMDGEWENAGLSDKFISFSEEYDYFLCLPQHKEACLHWLNGGDVQYDNSLQSKWCAVESIADSYESEAEYHECTVDDLGGFCPTEWSVESIFMRDDFRLRIKPKKEKRWIATLNGWNASRKVFASKQEAVGLLGTYGYQFHEIEVEV